MFAHAWFQHRDVFWKIENQEGLYIFYKTVCDVYNLIPEDNYTIPPEAEGLQEADKQVDEGGWTREPLHGTSNASRSGAEGEKSSRPSSMEIFSQASNASISEDYSVTNIGGENLPNQTVTGTGATTRRHKQTPSTGSFVTTIHEGDEEIPPPITSEPPPRSRTAIQSNAPAPGEEDKSKVIKSTQPIASSNTRDEVEESASNENVNKDSNTQELAPKQDSTPHILAKPESDVEPTHTVDQKSDISKPVEEAAEVSEKETVASRSEATPSIDKVSEPDPTSQTSKPETTSIERPQPTPQNDDSHKTVKDEESKADE